MKPENRDSADHAATLRVWERFCAEIARLVAEAGDALAAHLREVPFELRAVAAESDRRAADVLLGRAQLRLECPVASLPPGPHETTLASAFGADTPLVRILVRRDTASGATPHSWIACDPASNLWLSADGDLGLAHLDDRVAVERFFWGLLDASA